MTIGEKIREYRISNKLTQKQLGNELGLAEITIRQYESNKRTPNLERLFQISDILGISITDLMEKDEYNSAYELTFGKIHDKYIFNTVKSFLSLGGYVLRKEPNTSFSICKKNSEQSDELTTILQNLSIFDLEEISTWIFPYIDKVIDCMARIKENPSCDLRPDDPPCLQNNPEETLKKIQELYEIIQSSINKLEIPKFPDHYEIQKKLDEERNRASKEGEQ